MSTTEGQARRRLVLDPDSNADFVEFIDPNQIAWRVTERNTRGDPGARGVRCLIFACAEVIRRVWEYPDDWRTLSAAELFALSWRR